MLTTLICLHWVEKKLKDVKKFSNIFRDQSEFFILSLHTLYQPDFRSILLFDLCFDVKDDFFSTSRWLNTCLSMKLNDSYHHL